MTNTALSGRITGATMKIIALVVMTLDHFAHAFSMQLFLHDPPLTSVYYLLRFVGRIAFPMYAFMIAEGCRHTKNIRKYMALMAVFAFVSEVPFDLAGNRQWFDMRSQNVYFTLFLGLTACYVVRLLKENGKNIFLSIPITALLCASAFVLSTDYSWYGVLLIWLFAVSEEWPQRIRIPLLVLGLLLIGRPWNMIADGFAPSAVNNFLLQFAGSLFALVLILNYNGKRGNLRVNKYFFYAYYPAHLLLFGLVANYMF